MCVVQALLVPSQGFLNALAYGWTRGDFISVMSTRRLGGFPKTDSPGSSYGVVENSEKGLE